MNNFEKNVLINSDDLFKKITERQSHPEFELIIINILPSKYFDDCHIKDSINIEGTKIADYAEDWDRLRPIIIYGAADDLEISKFAYQQLIDMGFTDVRILLGGLQEWLDDGYPSEGECKMDYLQD